MPLAFSGDACSFGGSNSVVGGVRGMTGNMGGCSSVTGCTRGGASRRIIGITGGGVGSKCGSPDLAEFYLITHPSSPCFNLNFPFVILFLHLIC
ncbi:MAG: hypothetical protein NTU61_02420 [Candidatus Altiarchaeota archaeon]|nr:hypothetical protein [Candidatus Altiarchaeota archaeon]